MVQLLYNHSTLAELAFDISILRHLTVYFGALPLVPNNAGCLPIVSQGGAALPRFPVQSTSYQGGLSGIKSEHPDGLVVA